MKHVNLLMSSTSGETIETFAKKIFAIVGVDNYEERSSGHYVDGRYFLGRTEHVEFHVMLSDDSDHFDLPFWLQLSTVNLAEELNERDIDEMIHNGLLASGFRVARIDKFKQVGEQRTDY